MRQERKRRDQNRAQRSKLKTAIKKVSTAEGEAAQEAMRETESLLDRLSTRRLIHPNKAARKKSQLARVVREKTAV
jgi:small subunit ribosomal protein S20